MKCHECQAEVLGYCPTGSEGRGWRFAQLAFRDVTQAAVLPTTGAGEGRGWGRGHL